MKSGSQQIQKTMERQVPRKPGEYKKAWVVRAAKHYGITTIQAENIYYRRGYDIPQSMLLKLHCVNSTGSTPIHTITTDNENLQKLNAALEIKLKEAGEKQERLDHDFKRMVRGLQALCESLQAGSTMGRG